MVFISVNYQSICITWNIVIHESGDVILEQFHVLRYDMGGGSVLLVSHQLVVRLHDIRQFVSQVVLYPYNTMSHDTSHDHSVNSDLSTTDLVLGSAPHHDGRTNRQRRYGQHGYQHPVGPGKLWAQTEYNDLFICNTGL